MSETVSETVSETMDEPTIDAGSDPQQARVPAVGGADAASVRPPDLDAHAVRPVDPLEGWDVGIEPPHDLGPVDHPPFPLDPVIVGGAAVAGALVAAVTARGRAGAGRVLAGALLAAVAAGAARRVWRLP
jgi:hypothetical protein